MNEGDTSLHVDHIDWGNDMLVNVFPLWKEKILCDTTIVCENDESLQAHSILLAAASPSLYSFFRNSEQGTYVFRCTSVPLTIWKNCVTFIYTGRLDIGKEELVPTYNLANKLAMFNFSKQLATQLQNHGLVIGGKMKVLGEIDQKDKKGLNETNNEYPNMDVDTDKDNESKTDDNLGTETSDTQIGSPDYIPETVDGKPKPSTSDKKASTSGLQSDPANYDSTELESSEAEPANNDYEIDDIILSSTEDVTTGLGVDNRYECPHCFMNFKRLSALKKHLRCCLTSKTPNNHPVKASSKQKQHDSASPLMGKLKLNKGTMKEISNKGNYTQIRHMYTKKSDGQFQCNICDNAVKSYQGVYLHIKVKHLGTKYVRKKNKMAVAGANLKKKNSEGEEDILSELPSDTKPHCIVNNHPYYKLKCRTCGKLFKNKPTFIMHVKMHHSNAKLKMNQALPLLMATLPQVAPLPAITQSSGYLSNLSGSSHQSLPAMDDSSLITSGNSLTLPPSQSSNLPSTITTTPISLPTFVSSMSTSSESSSIKEPYKCHVCERTFHKKNNLGSHMRVHNPDFQTKPVKRKKKCFFK